MKKYQLFLFFSIISVQVFAGGDKTDSLKNAVLTSRSDTAKAFALLELSWEIKGYNTDSSILLATQALELSTKAGFIKGMGKANHNLGWYNHMKGNFDLSLDHYKKALTYWDKIGERKGKSRTLGNLAIIFSIHGDHPKALDYSMKALKIEKELGDVHGESAILGTISGIYYGLKDYQKAEEFTLEAFKIKEKLGDKRGMAKHLCNLGILAKTRRDYQKAMDYYYRGLKLNQELQDLWGIGSDYGNLGSFYLDAYQYYSENKSQPRIFSNNQQTLESLIDSSMYYLDKSLQVRQKISDSHGLTYTYSVIGDVYFTKKEYPAALKNFLVTYQYADTSGDLLQKKETAMRIYTIYKIQNKIADALSWHERYVSHSDTLFNTDKNKALGKKEAEFEFQKKLLEQQKEHEKLQIIEEEKQSKQRLITGFTASGLVVTIMMSLVIFNRLKVTRKQKSIIESQKSYIEEKNRDITDSITYAKQIQEAILPFEERFQSAFGQNYFILFKPKDIVSGDFYWFLGRNDKLFVAVVDCTGHGVPGAFMSMVGSSILNHIVTDKGIQEADKILDEMHLEVRKALKQDEGNNRDGMDLVLCVINKKDRSIEFAGANNPLYIFQNKELVVIKGDKFPIGGLQTEENRKFTKHIVKCNSSTTVYLSSDGYADQFGGEKGKKFKESKLRELLQSISNEQCSSQKSILNESFESWRGELEQVDDVCILGIRV